MDDLHQLMKYQNEYNALRVSAIVRRIILENAAFLHEMSRKGGRKLSFTINDHLLRDDPILSPGTVFLYENIAEGKTTVSIDRFLKQEICIIENRPATVSDLIKFLANKDGGVHFENARPGSKDEALRDISSKFQLGELGIAYKAMFDVASVVYSGLLPIYQMLRA